MKWIPRGYDIYVIGVQECLHLSETRLLIRHHIEGRTSPSTPASVAFRQFRRQIGSRNTSLGYHVRLTRRGGVGESVESSEGRTDEWERSVLCV